MKKATPNRFLTAGRPGVFKVKMSLGRAMKTTDLNGGLIGGFGTLGPASVALRVLKTAHVCPGGCAQNFFFNGLGTSKSKS